MGLFLLVFLTVSLGMIAAYQAASGFLFPDKTHVRRRIAEEFGKESQAAPSLLFKNLDQLNLEPQPDFADLDEAEAPPVARPSRGLQDKVQTLLDGAAVALNPQQVFLIASCLSLGMGAVGFLLGGPALGTPAAAAGAGAPFLFLHHKRNARRQKYLRQLPDAFELMARVTRAGQSVTQAFQAVADALEEPVAAEFADCQKQQNLGLRPEFVFQDMARRSGILEMRIFAMAMLIQRQTGGNLADVLERLAGLVRARLRLRERVRILTAEGRLQGWTLVVLPFVAFAVMMVVNRKYAEVLLEHRALLLGMVGSMGVGMWWIRRIVNFNF